MSEQPRYLLDANSFIRSKREHYAFDICPGYWDSLLQANQKGRVVSTTSVRDELLRGKDALADWVKDEVPEGFFESDKEKDGEIAYRRVVEWVENNKHYQRAAKQKFLSGADPRLIAAAIARHYVLVTYEVSAPESKAVVKVPDVARHFKVTCVPPYTMLRQLGVRLTLDERKSK